MLPSRMFKQPLIYLMLVLLSLVFSPIASAAAGEPAPDFTLKSNKDTNIRLKELKGNVVLINFWASWCGPCRQEMPLLEEIYKKYQKYGFELLAINVDEDSTAANDFLKTVDVSFPVLYDQKSTVSQLMGVDAMPTTFMVDREGNVRFAHKGYQPGYEKEYQKQVKKLIRE